jgi:hypothetical protein
VTPLPAQSRTMVSLPLKLSSHARRGHSPHRGTMCSIFLNTTGWMQHADLANPGKPEILVDDQGILAHGSKPDSPLVVDIFPSALPMVLLPACYGESCSQMVHCMLYIVSAYALCSDESAEAGSPHYYYSGELHKSHCLYSVICLNTQGSSCLVDTLLQPFMSGSLLAPYRF